MSIDRPTSAWNSCLSRPSDVAVGSSSERLSINLSSAASTAVVQTLVLCKAHVLVPRTSQRRAGYSYALL